MIERVGPEGAPRGSFAIVRFVGGGSKKPRVTLAGQKVRLKGSAKQDKAGWLFKVPGLGDGTLEVVATGKYRSDTSGRVVAGDDKPLGEPYVRFTVQELTSGGTPIADQKPRVR